jgi:hypothetical protein
MDFNFNNYKTIEDGVLHLDKDIDEVNFAIKLYLNSKILEAEDILKLKYGKTLYHTYGLGVLAVVKGIMTFDPKDIDYAKVLLKNTIDVAEYLKKKCSSWKSFILGPFTSTKNVLDMTKFQRHVEIISAETYLLKSILCIASESNIITIIKDGISIRKSYKLFKAYYKVFFFNQGIGLPKTKLRQRFPRR